MADEIVAGGPEPEAPAKPSVDTAALEEYFQSIKEPFRETREGLNKERKGVNGGFILFFIFSLIPLIPFVASKLVWHYFNSTVISVRTIRFHIGSFWFWWVVLFIVALTTLLIAAKLAGASAEEKKKWLSPAQMRFAYCYAVVDEIGKYRTNQLPRHIEAALDCLDKIAASLFPAAALPIDPYPDQYWRSEIKISQLQVAGIGHILTRPPKWYRLRPETEQILKGLGEFSPKLRDRLKDRKDLPEISTVLTYLASYQYLEIPELSDSRSEPRFEEGLQSLLIFAQRVTTLPPYRSEELKPTPRQKLSLKISAFMATVTAPFWHDNLLVAFIVWWFFLSLLFIGGFFGLLRVFPVKIDSAIITTLVAGPILGAVTAVTIPRVGRKKNGN
jgi:hypothetical protein